MRGNILKQLFSKSIHFLSEDTVKQHEEYYIFFYDTEDTDRIEDEFSPIYNGLYICENIFETDNNEDDEHNWDNVQFDYGIFRKKTSPFNQIYIINTFNNMNYKIIDETKITFELLVLANYDLTTITPDNDKTTNDTVVKNSIYNGYANFLPCVMYNKKYLNHYVKDVMPAISAASQGVLSRQKLSRLFPLDTATEVFEFLSPETARKLAIHEDRSSTNIMNKKKEKAEVEVEEKINIKKGIIKVKE